MKNFFAAKFLGKFVVKWILKLSAHLAYVATPRFRFDRIVALSLWPHFLVHPVIIVLEVLMAVVQSI